MKISTFRISKDSVQKIRHSIRVLQGIRILIEELCLCYKFSTIFINLIHIPVTKGQLISKCPYEMIVSSKIPTKLFLDFVGNIVQMMKPKGHFEIN